MILLLQLHKNAAQSNYFSAVKLLHDPIAWRRLPRHAPNCLWAQRLNGKLAVIGRGIAPGGLVPFLRIDRTAHGDIGPSRPIGGPGQTNGKADIVIERGEMA